MAIKHKARLWHSKPTELADGLYYWISIAAFNLALVRLPADQATSRLPQSTTSWANTDIWGLITIQSGSPPPSSPLDCRADGGDTRRNLSSQSWASLGESVEPSCLVLIFCPGWLLLLLVWPSPGVCPLLCPPVCVVSAEGGLAGAGRHWVTHFQETQQFPQSQNWPYFCIQDTSRQITW